MIKFNSNNIEIGYIKELLHSFNLPNIKVYDPTTQPWEDTLYIKDNKVMVFNRGEWRDVNENSSLDYGKTSNIQKCTFVLNKKIDGITTNLPIIDNTYDIITHNYLGEYLRFIRDYKGLNLMSMYNCFGGDVVKTMSVNIKNGNEDTIASFNSNDTRYTIYMIPVKFNSIYTIAIDCLTS